MSIEIPIPNLEKLASAMVISRDEMDLIKRTVAQGATDAELKLFLFDCQRRGVHPLDKLLHFTKRGGKYTPVTSIDFMRSQAAMSGEMAGSDDPVFIDGDGHPESAFVTVYRLTLGQRFAYSATARWSEYCPDNAPMWRRMPYTMLGKCAEALALRKAFPQQLAGLYSREEMDQAESGPGLSAASPASPTPPEKVLDTHTGEEVPASVRPTPPEGYRYIDACKDSGNGWTELTFHHAGGEGVTLTLSTRDERWATIATQAYQNGVPVRCKAKRKKGEKNAGYIEEIHVWRADVPTESIPQIANAADIPF